MVRASVRAGLLGLAAMTCLPATTKAQPAATVESAQAGTTFGSSTHVFDIPATDLADALQSWSRVSGIRLLVQADLVKGQRSQPVAGTLTAETALRQLLSGSRLGYRAASATAVALYDRDLATSLAGDNVLPPIDVAGQTLDSQHLIGQPPPPFTGGQVATGIQLGMLGNRSVFDTPFATTSYTAKTIDDQQARSLADVFANNPSVRTPAASDGVYDNLVIRGFPVTAAAFTLNGLPGMAPAQMVAPQYIDRLELLNGPSGLLSNVPLFGSVGGSVNIVPKRATDEPITAVTGTFQSPGQPGASLDVGRRFGENKEFGVRFNGVFNAGPAGAEDQSQRLGLGVLALDYRGERARIALDVGYQSQWFQAPMLSMLYNGPAGPVPAAPRAGSNPFQAWSYNFSQDNWAVLRGEFDVSQEITVYAAAGYKDGRSVLLSSYQEISDRSGNTIVYPYYEPYRTQNFAAEVGVRTRFETGFVGHNVNLAYATHRVRIGWADTFFPEFNSNIYARAPGPAPDVSGLPNDPPTTLRYNLSSFAFSDTLSVLDERIQLTAGFRFQSIKGQNIDGPTGIVTADYDSSSVTPAVALVVKPLSYVSIYANYIQGLSQGPIAPPGTLNAGQMFAPSITSQKEVGVKLDWGKWATTVALFEITQPSGITDAATNTFSVNGQQRNSGWEFNVFGEPIPGVRVLGGLAYTVGQLTSTADGLDNGNTAPGVPQFQANVNGEVDVPFVPGLTFTGRVIYTSMQYLDAANLQTLPDWTRFDVGIRYTHALPSTALILRANVENVANASYWSSAAGGTLSMGAPRRVLLSATAKF